MSKFGLREAVLVGAALTISCPNPDRQGQPPSPVAAQQEPGRSNDGQPAEVSTRQECARIGAEQRAAMIKVLNPAVAAIAGATGNFSDLKDVAFVGGDHGRIAEEGCLASEGLNPAR